MRDKRKDKEYFEKYIQAIGEHIHDTAALIEKVKNEKGEDFQGFLNGCVILEDYYKDMINGLYCIDEPIEKIEIIFPKLNGCITKYWRKGNSSYWNLIEALSLAVLLNAEKEEVEKLKELLKKENVKDYLIDYMMNYLDKDWEVKTDELMFKSPFSKLKKVTECENKKEALDLLKNYLDKDWYKSRKSTGWYDSHEKDRLLYSGYWSYEAGAVSKIMGLEDEDMREQQYYPYDMVHFKR